MRYEYTIEPFGPVYIAKKQPPATIKRSLAQNWRFTSINTTHKGAIFFFNSQFHNFSHPVLALNNKQKLHRINKQQEKQTTEVSSYQQANSQ